MNTQPTEYDTIRMNLKTNILFPKDLSKMEQVVVHATVLKIKKGLLTSGDLFIGSAAENSLALPVSDFI